MIENTPRYSYDVSFKWFKRSEIVRIKRKGRTYKVRRTVRRRYIVLNRWNLRLKDVLNKRTKKLESKWHRTGKPKLVFKTRRAELRKVYDSKGRTSLQDGLLMGTDAYPGVSVEAAKALHKIPCKVFVARLRIEGLHGNKRRAFITFLRVSKLSKQWKQYATAFELDKKLRHLERDQARAIGERRMLQDGITAVLLNKLHHEKLSMSPERKRRAPDLKRLHGDPAHDPREFSRFYPKRLIIHVKCI